MSKAIIVMTRPFIDGYLAMMNRTTHQQPIVQRFHLLCTPYLNVNGSDNAMFHSFAYTLAFSRNRRNLFSCLQTKYGG